MEEELRERFFNSAQESPGGWLLRALSFRAAAARLDWQVLPPRDNEPVISLLAEYRMLLGLAFENLLKAIISLVRLNAGISPALPKECHIHALETLAGRLSVCCSRSRLENSNCWLIHHRLSSGLVATPYLKSHRSSFLSAQATMSARQNCVFGKGLSPFSMRRLGS